MTENSRNLWIERNSIETNSEEIEDLLEYFKVVNYRQEVYLGDTCLRINRGLDTFKIIVNKETCSIQIVGINTRNKKQKNNLKQEKNRFIAEFQGDCAWFNSLKSLFANNIR